MATKEEQETLRLLVQHVSRSFYDHKFTIIMDQLARHPVLKDDDLASRMGLQSKELNKLMAILTKDRLVQAHRQNELKEGAQRSVLKQYYYIDYQHFCNVVKWRVAEMRRRIDSTQRNEQHNKGFVCPQCSKQYSPLDVDRLMDPMQMAFVCEDCGAELVDHQEDEGNSDRMQRFNKQMTYIREGLRKSEAMMLPAFDVAAWVVKHSSEADRQRAEQSGGLKVAGSGPSGRADDGIGIVMSLDKDEATRRQEMNAEADAKRQQNLLPTWIAKSTVSGILTASGIAESVRADAAAASRGSSSNDQILKGLGTVGKVKVEENKASIEVDVKPIIDKDSIDYDRYYASLAASATVSSTGTPSRLGIPNGDDFGGSDSEEDRKPNIEYLDSLNDYRKRSRSRDDIGTPKSKVARLSDINNFETSKLNSNGNGHLPVHTIVELATPDVGDDVVITNDPVVYVNGIAKPFSEVTEDDHELMTPEEYTAYFEVLETQPVD